MSLNIGVTTEGDVSCGTAKTLADTFFNQAPSGPPTSGGPVDVDGWSCSSETGDLGEGAAPIGHCEKDDAKVSFTGAH